MLALASKLPLVLDCAKALVPSIDSILTTIILLLFIKTILFFPFSLSFYFLHFKYIYDQRTIFYKKRPVGLFSFIIYGRTRFLTSCFCWSSSFKIISLIFCFLVSYSTISSVLTATSQTVIK